MRSVLCIIFPLVLIHTMAQVPVMDQDETMVKVEIFTDSLLGPFKQLRVYTEDKPAHFEFYSKDGVNSYSAYSDMRYPTTGYSYYEHYTLFMVEYRSEELAKKTFNSLCKKLNGEDLDLDTKKEWVKVRKMKAKYYVKAGGMILQHNNYVLNLVENCRNTPIRGTWTQYEDLLLSYLFKENDTVRILNANCGDSIYSEENRTVLAPNRNLIYER